MIRLKARDGEVEVFGRLHMGTREPTILRHYRRMVVTLVEEDIQKIRSSELMKLEVR